MINFTEISDSEWDAFMGAENFANGSRPVTGSFEIVGDPALATMFVIAAGNGIDVVSEEGDSTWHVADHQDLVFFLAVKPQMSRDEFTALISGHILVEI